MTKRKVHINGQVWEYFVGKSNVKIWPPDTKPFVVSSWDIKGVTPNTFERGQWKKTSDGSVTPSEIKSFIMKRIS